MVGDGSIARVTQEDGAQAWTSPVYLETPASER